MGYAYEFKGKLLRKIDLQKLSEQDSSFIFHQFSLILRKYSISDKSNAFNKIFDIKEVFDLETFDDNQKILKEIVSLLQKYQICYPRKQQHLSDFFERLLTTGLKQESGQFFTPPPIARYIIKSLPIKEIIDDKLAKETAELPSIIDYACGSW